MIEHRGRGRGRGIGTAVALVVAVTATVAVWVGRRDGGRDGRGAGPTAPAGLGNQSEPARIGGRLVFLRDNTLMEFDGATTRSVWTAPVSLGFSPSVHAIGSHVMVQLGGAGYLFDATRWGRPALVGPFLNSGIVLGDDGFWAADPLLSAPQRDRPSPAGHGDITMRLYDWQGMATPVTVFAPSADARSGSPDKVIPVGVVDDGIVGLRTNDGRALLLTANGVEDLGRGNPLQTSSRAIAVLRAPPAASAEAFVDRLAVFDMTTRTEQVLAPVPPGLAPVVRFSPDGGSLAVVTTSATGGSEIVIADLGTTSRRRAHPAPARSFPVWDGLGQLLLVKDGGNITIVDPERGPIGRLTVEGGVGRGAVVVP